MLLSDKSENDSGLVTFADITKTQGRSSSAWMDEERDVAKRSAAVITLRPPRLPGASECAVLPAFALPDDRKQAFAPEPERDHEPYHPEDDNVEVEKMIDDRPEPHQHVEVRERRRTDTMIDDIVPRAEEEAIVAIKQAVEQVAQERARVFDASERQLVELALVIARRVIAREVSLDPGIVKGLVREGLKALGAKDRVVVRVGTFFSEMSAEIQREIESANMSCHVVVDSSLGSCGCVVETELGRVDESIEDRLATLLDGLVLDSGRGSRG